MPIKLSFGLRNRPDPSGVPVPDAGRAAAAQKTEPKPEKKPKGPLRNWLDDIKPSRLNTEFSLPGFHKTSGLPRQRANKAQPIPPAVSKAQQELDELDRAAEGILHHPIITGEQPSHSMTDAPASHQSKNKFLQKTKEKLFRPRPVLPDRRSLEKPQVRTRTEEEQSMLDDIAAVQQWYKNKLKEAKENGDEPRAAHLQKIIEQKSKVYTANAAYALPEQRAYKRAASAEVILNNDIKVVRDTLRRNHVSDPYIQVDAHGGSLNKYVQWDDEVRNQLNEASESSLKLLNRHQEVFESYNGPVSKSGSGFLPGMGFKAEQDAAKNDTQEKHKEYQSALALAATQQARRLNASIAEVSKCWAKPTDLPVGSDIESIQDDRSLQNELRVMANKMEPDTSATALSKAGIINIAMLNLSEITATPGEGLSVLKELQAHSPLDLNASIGSGISPQLQAFFSLMSQEPRGLEMLELLRGTHPRLLAPQQGESEPETVADQAQREWQLTRLQASSNYWQAHALCQQTDTTPEDKKWLEAGMKIARQVAGIQQPEDSFINEFSKDPQKRQSGYAIWLKTHHPEVEKGVLNKELSQELAAFNAMRSGMFSKEPGSLYDTHQKRCTQAVTDWIKHSDMLPNATARVLRRFFGPGALTPFANMPQAQRVATFMHHTNRREADELLAGVAQDLMRITTDESWKNLPDIKSDLVTIQALAEQVVDMPQHLLSSKAKIKYKDRRSIHKEIRSKTNERPHLSAVELRFLKKFSRQKSVKEALQKAYECLEKTANKSDLSTEQHSALQDDLDAVAQKIKLVSQADARSKIKTIENPEQLYELLKPMAAKWTAHDMFEMREKASVGVHIGTAPLNWVLDMVGLSPFANAIYDNSKTSAINMHAYTHLSGLEFKENTGHEVQVNAGLFMGFKSPKDVVFAGGQVNSKASCEFTDQHSTAFRFVSLDRSQQENGDAMEKLVRSSFLFDHFKTPEAEPLFADPMEAVLALNPEACVVDIHTETVKWGGEAGGHVGAHAGFEQLKAIGGRAVAGLNGQFYKTRNHLKESDNVELKHQLQLNAVDINANLFATAAIGPGTTKTWNVGESQGTVGVSRVPLMASMGVQMARRAEDAMLLDLDLDRKKIYIYEQSFKKINHVQVELESKPNEWLDRSMREAPSNKSGETHTSENQRVVRAMLDQHKLELSQLSKKSRHLYYYIAHASRPEASALVSEYEALAKAHLRKGNIEKAKDYLLKVNDIQCNADTYVTDQVFVREKGNDSTSWVWPFLLRRKRSAVAEVHSGATVYPLRGEEFIAAKEQYLSQSETDPTPKL